MVCSIIVCSVYNFTARYVLLVLMAAGLWSTNGAALAYASSAFGDFDPQVRGVSLAMVNALGNLAQIYGSVSFLSIHQNSFFLPFLTFSTFPVSISFRGRPEIPQRFWRYFRNARCRCLRLCYPSHLDQSWSEEVYASSRRVKWLSHCSPFQNEFLRGFTNWCLVYILLALNRYDLYGHIFHYMDISPMLEFCLFFM